MSNNPIISLLIQLFKIFCGGSQGKPNQQQQQQQQQQYGQYPQQQQPQYGGYPGQQNQQQYQQQFPPYQQQQQQYPPQQQQQQQQQPWSQVASGPNQQQHGGYQQSNFNQNQQYHGQQNGGYQSKPHGVPSGGIIGPHHPHGQDENMINQANEKYVAMRNQARHEGDEAHKCFAQSQQAYKSGDGQKAHELSVEGKAHAKKQDDIDEEAANWIYHANNTDSPPGTIDLHGLYVQEAIQRTEAAISQAQSSGQEELNVIVGKGIHSKGHVAKIKPAVEELMQKYNLSAHLDPHNAGVLVVDLKGRQMNGRSRDAGGLVDEIGQKGDGDCVIM